MLEVLWPQYDTDESEREGSGSSADLESTGDEEPSAKRIRASSGDEVERRMSRGDEKLLGATRW